MPPKPTRVLLVEDNELNRDMLSRRLERKGFQIMIAVDGKEGLDRALNDRPDIILMDMSLPVLPGWDATRALKADARTRLIPVIALTAHAMMGDREKALEAGCDDYDTKPVDLPRLLSKIEAALNKSAAPAAVKAASVKSDSLDTSVLTQLRDVEFAGDASAIELFVETFMNNSTKLFDEFAQAIERHNNAELERIAHMLRGSSLSIGANALGQLWGDVEKAARKGDSSLARERRDDIREEMNRVFVALKPFRH